MVLAACEIGLLFLFTRVKRYFRISWCLDFEVEHVSAGLPCCISGQHAAHIH